MFSKNDKVVWVEVRRRGGSIAMNKCNGVVDRCLEGDEIVVMRDGNHHRITIKASKLTKKENDDALSLVRQARQIFNI